MAKARRRLEGGGEAMMPRSKAMEDKLQAMDATLDKRWRR